jgi:hypothetical protein
LKSTIRKKTIEPTAIGSRINLDQDRHFGGAARYLEHATMLLSSMSALMRIPDSSQTSRHVRKVPKSDIDSTTIRPLRRQES